MRVFISINFDDPLKSELMNVISTLKKYSIKGNFTRSENLHLTLAYIGELATNRLDQLIHSIEKVCFQTFALELLDLGQFQKYDEALVFWKTTCPKELLSYRQRLLEELRLANFSVDEKDFVPHITLGRRCVMKESFSNIHLSQHIQSKRVSVNEICLMKSEQVNGLLTYTKLYGRKDSTRNQ